MHTSRSRLPSSSGWSRNLWSLSEELLQSSLPLLPGQTTFFTAGKWPVAQCMAVQCSCSRYCNVRMQAWWPSHLLHITAALMFDAAAAAAVAAANFRAAVICNDCDIHHACMHKMQYYSRTVLRCIAQQVTCRQLVIAFCLLTATLTLNSSSVHCGLALAHDALHAQSMYQNCRPVVYAGQNALACTLDMQRLGRGCL